jgi:hypothetical protein
MEIPGTLFLDEFPFPVHAYESTFNLIKINLINFVKTRI